MKPLMDNHGILDSVPYYFVAVGANFADFAF